MIGTVGPMKFNEATSVGALIYHPCSFGVIQGFDSSLTHAIS